jgi:hypothetical protein
VNVTVLVPSDLKRAVEGRVKLTLGFPPAATVGDVVETLLRLYPRLSQHLLDERKPDQAGLSLFLSEQASRPLRDGDRLYVFATAPRRQEGSEG